MRYWLMARSWLCAFRREPQVESTVDSAVLVPKLPDSSGESTIIEQPITTSHLQEDALRHRFTGHDQRSTRNPPENPTKDINNAVPSVIRSNIEAKHLGSIAVIELNRPRAKNAISRQMLSELSIQIDKIYAEAHSHQVRALIISSTMDNAFCAGADLKERRCMTMDETGNFLAELRHAFSRLAALPVPSIACVSGYALGGGLELALCCHFRIFSEYAAVGLPETRLAIVPGAGGTYRLQKLVGIERALDMILTGRRVEAVEAARIGLCSRLIMSDEKSCDLEATRKATFAAGLSLAQEIAKGGPIAIRAAFGAVIDGTEEAANVAYDEVLATEDRITALQHFGKGTSPRFVGR